MNKTKKQRLEAKGWKVGTVREFLSLSPEETEYVELKLTLSKNLQERRRSLKLTQHQMARLLKSSQSLIAKSKLAILQFPLNCSFDLSSHCGLPEKLLT